MTRSWGRRRAEDLGGALDRYAYAFLAGGRRRVVESAVVALTEQGVLSLRANRLRPTGEVRSTHGVEHAVVAACPRSKRVEEVIDAVGRSQQLDDLARQLVCLGLLSGRRQRTTRSGRRLLAAAVSEGSLPGYVLEGPAVLATGPVRCGLLSATSIPDGLGRTLRRMGKALDDDHSSLTDGAPSGGVGCGGSSGGD
ncbi:MULTISPECIES: TIGR04222 domain-containing membrane protein [Streptomyces]|uniref:TIGR04222 domain-containing membrane protein n=1 Tax=Streptomyces TaxID=1883 RepID=UPI000BF1CB7F|nr:MULTISPECIES: TIGR04222 domain-containing membrane protein [unclassified Streptomyces]WTD14766.1 TIGR04222 domain-containing membrane protein [Streptomyces anulatus]WTE08076.1 TIGR04222 domain-containing membrane protein [Streptomyces anulatus]